MSAQLNTRMIVHTLAPVDNENGTETHSNRIAYRFWRTCGAFLYRFNTYSEVLRLYNMFISSNLLPRELKNTPRSFNQVLVSLSRGFVHNTYSFYPVCTVDNQCIVWDYDARRCKRLRSSVRESSSGMEQSNSVSDTAHLFFHNNMELLKQLKHYGEIKFFYELWSTTHDDIMLACVKEEILTRNAKTGKTVKTVRWKSIPRPSFEKILFALSLGGWCRVVKRGRKSPIIQWIGSY